MKKTFPITLLLLLAFSFTVFAQPGAGGTGNNRIEYAATSEDAAKRPCNAGRAGVQRRRGYGNRSIDTCTEVLTGTFSWVDSDPIVRPEKFGLSAGATSANNSSYMALALAAAAAGYPIIELPEGQFDFNSEIYLPSGVTLRGKGAEKTILRYAKSTGAFIRAVNYGVGQSGNRIEKLQLIAISPAVNANTIGIDLSSISHSIVEQVRVYNFGTQFLIDGHRSGGLISSYYNNLYDCFAGMGSAGYAFISKGFAIQNGANSNHIFRPKTSYLTYPFAIGDSANEAPNQLVIDDPVSEGWEGTAVYVPKAIGLIINFGRWEGLGANARIFDIDDSSANVNGVTINRPYLEPTGTITVLRSLNPTVQIIGGNYRSYVTKKIGLSSDVGNNLITNGGFEGWPPTSNYPLLGWLNINGTDWSSGTIFISREPTKVKSGLYSIRLGNTVNLGVGLRSPTIGINPRYPYTLDWWSQGTTTTVGYRIGFKIFNSSNTEITTGWTTGMEGVGEDASGGTSGIYYSGGCACWLLGGDITHAAADTWTRNSYAFSFPSSAATVQVGFINMAVPLQYVYFDDVQLVQGQAALAFSPKAISDSGDQSLNGILTAPRFTASDPFQTGSGMSMGMYGTEGLLKHFGGGRIYYDAYSHVWRRENSSTGLMRLNESGLLFFGTPVFSEDVAIKRYGANALEINTGTSGVFGDLRLRKVTLTGTETLANAAVAATSGGTTALDLSLGNIRTVTMPAGNTTLTASNVPVGYITISIIQDATGGRTVTWNSLFKFSGATAPTLGIGGAGSRDEFQFKCDGTNCQCVGSTLDVR